MTRRPVTAKFNYTDSAEQLTNSNLFFLLYRPPPSTLRRSADLLGAGEGGLRAEVEQPAEEHGHVRRLRAHQDARHRLVRPGDARPEQEQSRLLRHEDPRQAESEHPSSSFFSLLCFTSRVQAPSVFLRSDPSAPNSAQLLGRPPFPSDFTVVRSPHSKQSAQKTSPALSETASGRLHQLDLLDAILLFVFQAPQFAAFLKVSSGLFRLGWFTGKPSAQLRVESGLLG